MVKVYRNAQVITDGKIIPAQDVIAADGKIKSIVPCGTADFSCTQQCIDLDGKYLAPGFIDAHSHIGISEEKITF